MEIDYFDRMTAKYIIGHVKNCQGITYRSSPFLSDPITPPNNWYGLRIEVANNKNVKVYQDNVYKGQFNAFFNTRGFGGVAIANGYSTTMQFRNFEIAPMN